MDHRLLVAITLALAACGRTSSSGPSASTTAPTASAAAAASSAPAPAATSEESPADQIDKLGYADALKMAVPLMEDETGGEGGSRGSLLFTVWAAKHMHWSDVSVAKDETSYALVRKDSESERGKRMCTSGQLVQIEVERLPTGGKVSTGLLDSNAGNLYHFITAGSSGQLVEQSYARVCGVVTGSYDYENSAGGTGHAVGLIGMFDLPENKPKKQ